MSALPHNLEAEQGLLGALLFDNRIIERLPAIAPGMFFDPVHGRIFKTIADLIRGGRLADGVTLRKRFEEDGGLKEIGGAGYLMALMETAAKIPAHAVEYAVETVDLYQRREAITAAEAIAHDLRKSRDESAAEIIRRGEKSLQGLTAGGKSWVSAREAGVMIAKSLDDPAPRGMKTGIAKLDELLGGGLYAPDFVVIAGRPAMGKTALADNISANVAREGKVVGSFSMEMSAEQIAARIIAKESVRASGPRVRHGSFRRKDARPDRSVVDPLVARVPETLLIDETGAQSLAGIEASAKNMRRAMGQLDLIVIDYLQLMQESGAKKEGRTRELSEITAGLKALAKKLSVPVIALSQLSRAVESRQDKRPQLSDLRESGSIEQDADIVLFVYREHYYLERATPQRGETEDRSAFAVRQTKHAELLDQTQHEIELFTGKNRHGATSKEQLFCDLAVDLIADEMPTSTPPRSRVGQDGVS